MNDETNPFAEVAKAIQHFKIPGLDVAALVEAGRKDADALVEANRAAYRGMQALAHKQGEILSHALQRIREVASHAADAPTGAKTTETAHAAYRKTLADMKELADIVRKSQAEALTKITDRAIDHLQELKKMIQPK
ncbi:MAG TPA: phasin family protein [Steroidobacteraceae bacterium]|nr:phasin family protein [Steroidobacteraceae bacterium]